MKQLFDVDLLINKNCVKLFFNYYFPEKNIIKPSLGQNGSETPRFFGKDKTRSIR